MLATAQVQVEVLHLVGAELAAMAVDATGADVEHGLIAQLLLHQRQSLAGLDGALFTQLTLRLLLAEGENAHGPVMQMKKFLLAASAICSLSPALAGINEIPDEVRDACLPAADFAGCVKAFTEKKEDKGPKLDRFGMPVIEDAIVYDNVEQNTIYYANPYAMQVKVRGMFGRYIYYTYVARWYQQAIAGTSGSSTTIGSASTNCYGYGASMSCTTIPAPTINIPGRAAVAGGVRSEKVGVFIDCLDRKAQWRGRGKWVSIQGKKTTQPIVDNNCYSITSLPKANEDSDAKGRPNERDLLAARVLPGSTPQQIRAMQEK